MFRKCRASVRCCEDSTAAVVCCGLLSCLLLLPLLLLPRERATLLMAAAACTAFALPLCTARSARSCCQLLQFWMWEVSLRSLSVLFAVLCVLLLPLPLVLLCVLSAAFWPSS